MTKEMTRPFDLLDSALNNPVIVKLKEEMTIRGILKTFDQHMNIVLADAEEIKGEQKEKIGSVIVRGDNILYVSP